jgi:hypothetical protein
LTSNDGQAGGGKFAIVNPRFAFQWVFAIVYSQSSSLVLHFGSHHSKIPPLHLTPAFGLGLVDYLWLSTPRKPPHYAI